MSDAQYNTSQVYREEDTGKIRIKGISHIADVAESPADAADNAVKINEILAMLTALGVNPDA